MTGRFAAVACALLLAARIGSADEPKGYVCYRASGPVAIDGRLDEESWKAAPWTDAFVDIEGDAKPRPRFGTRAKMLWDDRYFYVAAELEEPHVWGTLTEHDSVIFHDNDFEVFIDPDGDNDEYYELEINALNTEWDLFLKKPYRDGGPAENGWEIPGLKTAVHVRGTLNDPGDTDRGWAVELAIPWAALAEYAHRPAPPRDGDRWRVNFSRVEWRADVVEGRYRKRPGLKEDNWVWSPQGAVDMHRNEKWGYVQFTEKTRGPVPFRRDPTAPARDLLGRLYYAQKRYKESHARYAATLGDLGIEPAPGEGTPRLRASDGGYEATVEAPAEGGGTVRLRMGPDSRVRVEKPD